MPKRRSLIGFFSFCLKDKSLFLSKTHTDNFHSLNHLITNDHTASSKFYSLIPNKTFISKDNEICHMLQLQLFFCVSYFMRYNRAKAGQILFQVTPGKKSPRSSNRDAKRYYILYIQCSCSVQCCWHPD